jgi:hypothetical protein
LIGPAELAWLSRRGNAREGQKPISGQTARYDGSREENLSRLDRTVEVSVRDYDLNRKLTVLFVKDP